MNLVDRSLGEAIKELEESNASYRVYYSKGEYKHDDAKGVYRLLVINGRVQECKK